MHPLMMRRLLKAAGLVAGSLVAALTVLAIFLAISPLPLTMLEPTLRAIVARATPDLDVTFEAPALRWNPGIRALELAVRNLDIRDRAGKELFHVAQAAISPDITASLTSGRLAVGRLVLDRPTMAITRRADGGLGLRILDKQPVQTGAAEGDPWAAAAEFLGRVLAPSAADDPLAGIAILRAQNAQLLLEDQALQRQIKLGGVTIELRRRPGPAAIDAQIRLGAGGRAGAIDVQVRRLAEPDRYRLHARLDDVVPALLPFIDTTPILQGVDIALDGSLDWSLTADGHPSQATFSLRSRPKTLTLSDALPAPVAVGPIEVAGSIDPEAKALDIERLAGGVAGSEVKANGRFSLGADGIVGDGKATVGSVDMVQLGKLWPKRLAPDARRWIEKHVEAGSVGRATAHLTLGPSSGSDRVRYGVDAQLDRVTIRGLLPGVDLSDGMLSLRLAETTLTASGRAQLGSGPLTLKQLRVDFDGHGPPTTTAQISAPIDLAFLSMLGVEPPDFLGGSADVDLLVNVPGAGPPNARILADLRRTRITLPALGIDKTAGEPGYIDADVVIDAAGGVSVPVLDLSLPDGEAIGSLALAGKDHRLARLDLRHLDFRGSLLSLSAARSGADGWVIEVKGRRLDLRPWMGEGGSSAGDRAADADAGSGWTLPALSFTVDVAEVALPGGWLHSLKGTIERSATAWQEGSLAADLSGGAPVQVRLSSEGARPPRVVVRTDDAGGLLGAIATGSTFAPGGTFRLRTDVMAEAPSPRLEGDLDMRGVTLRGAPLVARLLTLASFTGILNTLRGEGIHFDRIRSDFSLADGTLTLTDGRASGSQVGLTVAGGIDLDAGTLSLSGTVVPAYSINRLLGSVPIVGRLLRGESGIGAFAVTYSVRGPAAGPSVSVNPLSVLVPGFIRDLFGNSVPVPPSPAPGGG